MKLFKTEEHEDVVNSLHCMGYLYDGMGQKHKALEIYQKVLSKGVCVCVCVCDIVVHILFIICQISE